MDQMEQLEKAIMEATAEGLAILKKSQMGFDFSGSAHDHHAAYTRTNASGTVSQIKQKGTATPKPVRPPAPPKPTGPAKDANGKYILPGGLNGALMGIGMKNEDWNDNPNFYTKELDRYRRHDHGGGRDGDGWLGDDAINDDFKRGATAYKSKLDFINKNLDAAGFEPTAEFELGEKGHFSIEVYLRPKVFADAKTKKEVKTMAEEAATPQDFMKKLFRISERDSYYFGNDDHKLPMEDLIKRTRSESEPVRKRIDAIKESKAKTIQDYWEKKSGKKTPLEPGTGEAISDVKAVMSGNSHEGFTTDDYGILGKYNETVRTELGAKGFTQYHPPEKARYRHNGNGPYYEGTFQNTGNSWGAQYMKKGGTTYEIKTVYRNRSKTVTIKKYTAE